MAFFADINGAAIANRFLIPVKFASNVKSACTRFGKRSN